MRYEIHGEILPSVDVILEGGEAVYTERGGMAWMRGNIDMNTGTQGGLLAGLGRKLAGESLFMTTYTCRGAEGVITFTPEAPGTVMAMYHCPEGCLYGGRDFSQNRDAFPQASWHWLFRW